MNLRITEQSLLGATEMALAVIDPKIKIKATTDTIGFDPVLKLELGFWPYDQVALIEPKYYESMNDLLKAIEDAITVFNAYIKNQESEVNVLSDPQI